MNVAIVLQVLSFLAANKEDIKQLILSLETLTIDGLTVAGSSKAEVVKGYISVASGLIAEVEAVWPVIQPVFNGIVAAVKGTK